MAPAAYCRLYWALDLMVGSPDPRLRIYEPLRRRALERVELALKVAVFVRLGFTRTEIAERLGVTARDVRHAIDELQDIAGEIEVGERPGDEVD